MSRTRARESYILAGKTIAFVPHPTERGMWLRTHPSVPLVACPQCQEPAGNPCTGARGYSAGTHYVRRTAGKKALKQAKRELVIIVSKNGGDS